jgi:hypothetical protein
MVAVGSTHDAEADGAAIAPAPLTVGVVIAHVAAAAVAGIVRFATGVGTTHNALAAGARIAPA